MQAYCMKCKKKVDVQGAKQVTLKNKRTATQGTCKACRTKVFKMGAGK